MTDGATTYKWEKHPYGYVPYNIITTRSKINELTLVNLQPHYGGNYRCLATNGSGSSFSNFTSLAIKGLFNIIIRSVYVRVQIQMQGCVCLIRGKNEFGKF